VTRKFSGFRALRREAGFYGGIVSKLAKDGGGFLGEEGLGGFEGLFDAEAHAAVFCDEDLVACFSTR